LGRRLDGPKSQSGNSGEEKNYLPLPELKPLIIWPISQVVTTGCGISHEDIKHMDKCSNNKTKTTQKQNYESTDKYFSKYCKDNTKEV
jgi:hypothetical protein